ncbi:hypothetical protein Gohar_025151, partial [Gossypium harknessii]|nr:hypothetical protein [Gossypium harknessii]
GPQRVRFFLWLALKQRLLTNAERARRGLGIDGVCQVCGHGSEDIMHVLRDCPATRDIWNKLIPVDKGSSWNIDEIISYLTVGRNNMPLAPNLHYMEQEVLLITTGSKERGNGIVLIQMDSLEAVNAIQEDSAGSSTSTLVRRVHQLLKSIRL